MKKQILFAGATAGLSLACALPASAQSIDYGSLEQLFNEPVTTSATGSPQRAPEAPADMQIISQEDIRRSGAFDLPTIISRVAGVDVLPFSAGHTDINVRGYNQSSSPRLLVLINGRQVYLDHYGMTFWRNLPVQLSEIRQIEVVKGPNTALFGFNAVSGVVNIITYNPKFDDTNTVQAYGGTGDIRGGSLVLSHKFGKAFAARLSVGGETGDEWENRVPADRLRLIEPSSIVAALDTVTQLTATTELRVEGSYANSTQSSIAGSAYSPTKTQTHSVKATLTSDTEIGLLQFSAYENNLASKYQIIGRTMWDNRIRVFNAQDIFKVGTAHTFRIGGEYRHNTLNIAPADTGDISYDVYSGSGMWNWAVNDKLATTVALRYDSLQLKRTGTFPARTPMASNANWDQEVNELSVNAAVVWRPTAEDTLRVSYGRGVQAPTLVELGGLQALTPISPTVSFVLGGNPALRPSIVENYQVSYDRNLPSLNARFGARIFWQEWSDIKGLPNSRQPDIAPTATTNPLAYFVNVGDSEMKGFELTASGKLGKGFRWSADYTYTDVEDKPFRGVDLTVRGAAFERTTPKSRGNVAFGWANPTWEIDSFVRYQSKFDFFNTSGGGLSEISSYVTVGARAAYRLENGLTFAVSGQNLLDDEQRQTTGLRAERRVQFAITKAW